MTDNYDAARAAFWDAVDAGVPPGVIVDALRVTIHMPKLNALRDAVDGERWEEARRLIGELEAVLGEDNPQVFFYRQLVPGE